MLLLLLSSGSARAAIYTVNSADDLPDADPNDDACATAPPNSVCTLRGAVMQANAHPGPDTIFLPAGTYVLTRVGFDENAEAGDLDVTDDLSIEGLAAASSVIIDANGSMTSDRAFDVRPVPGAGLHLSSLTVKNGNTLGNGGAISAQSDLSLANVVIASSSAQSGGGIYVSGGNVNLTIHDSAIVDNVANGSGGGIEIEGSAAAPVYATIDGTEIAGNVASSQVQNSFGGGINATDAIVSIASGTIRGNTAANVGGGVCYETLTSGDQITIDNTVFDHNTATLGNGGGLHVLGALQISGSVFSNNQTGGEGGGIYAVASGTILRTDVSISGNTAAGNAGGAHVDGSATLARVRVSDNTTTTGNGGGLSSPADSPGTLTITDSAIFGNASNGGDGGGLFTRQPTTLKTSAIYNNHAGRGGGVFAAGSNTVDIADSILDGNAAGSYGGGVYADAGVALTLHSATITGNNARTAYPAAGNGGGTHADPAATVTAGASVLAYNRNSPFSIGTNDCGGTLYLDSYNFVGSNAGCTVAATPGATANQVGGAYPASIDPKLSSLQPLYDSTLPANPSAHAKFGRAPLAGSPLIDAGPPGGCADASGPLLVDEIGEARAINGRCDIGAVEYGAAADRVFAGGFDG